MIHLAQLWWVFTFVPLVGTDVKINLTENDMILILESGDVRDVPIHCSVRGLRIVDIQFSVKDLIEFNNLPVIIREFWLRSIKNQLTVEARERIGV